MNANQFLHRGVILSFLLSFWLIPPAARGQTAFWRVAGLGPPNGVWDTTSLNWSDQETGGPNVVWSNTKNAVFSSGDLLPTDSFTVTLATNVTVGNLTYTGGNLDSMLQLAVGGPGANTITTAGPTMNVAVDFGTTLVVAPAIAGDGNLALQGGILVLSGSNTYSGGTTTISMGTLQLGSGILRGSIIGTVVNNDTFNIVNADVTGITAIINNGTTNFMNSSTAGSVTIINNAGATNFFNSSTAGNSLINNEAFTQFFDTATAGNATVVTNNSAFTVFFDSSTAGNATLTVNSGGEADFNNTSTAGAAKITNNASGFTNFNNTSTAGAATITNNGGATRFLDQSTAGNANITNVNGGETNFSVTSTAGNANINTGDGGLTEFSDSSTAGAATITTSGGETDFNNTSTAGTANLVTNGNGITKFLDSGTAANSVITTRIGGTTEFLGTSTAGHAAITNSFGGLTEFIGASTAGNATITNTSNGVTLFSDTANAGAATITTNSGGVAGFLATSTGASSTLVTNSGGLTLFRESSTGGQARLIANAGGIVDITNLSSAGMTAGSIEGAGTYVLGSKTLTVGLNNLSTLVSGIIVDEADLPPAGALAAGVLAREAPSGTGGALIKVGTGTLTLTGSNSYSGGTSFNGGILAVKNDANLGIGPLSFNGGTLEALASGPGITSSKAITLNSGGGTFLADAGSNSALSTAIGGAGSLTKDGPGALVLSGNNIYEGGTVLNAGTLTVNGAQALGLGNVTVNGGILRTDPQPINVKGNYTQAAGGTLQLQVAGANLGQYDTLNVGGNATLGGTLQLISLGFQPKTGNQLTLVSTGGEVSGRFAQFVDPFAAQGFTIAALIYEPNSVLLEFRTIASFARTPNQLAAGTLIDAVHLDPRAANLISFFEQEPLANLPNDLEKISPDGLTAFYEIGFSNANVQKLTLDGRLDDLHNGSNGFSSNMKVNGATVNEQTSADGKSSKAVVEPVLQHAPENRWGVWMTGFGDFADVDGDGNARGYNFTTGGVSLGLDYRITDQLAIGVFGDYSHTWTSLNPSGHLDVDSGRGGVYATWFNHGLYFDAAIYGGHNNYDSGRAGLGGMANGSTEGAEWSTFISGGYDFHLGSLTVGPIASLQYTDVGIDSFSEKGSLAPLAIHSDSAESLRSDVGFRTFYQWQIGKILVEPSLKAAWEHEYKYSALPITAGFAGIPEPSATFFGPAEGHDSAIVSAGVSVQFTPAITTYLNYDGQLGRGNYDSNAVTGGVRFSF